jgi:N-acetyl sugar amidotransferase
MDSSVPDIVFDSNGQCNYCKIHDAMIQHYPRGVNGKEKWLNYVADMKKDGIGKEFDCIIGISGGTDSSYLLHIAIENGLRPLAVNFDNGWNSDIAVSNIKKVTSKLNIPLYTYVVDYEEMKDILLAFMKAGLPWIDAPTDYAIFSTLYKTAIKHNIQYVLSGNDFRSEGKQPLEWTYSDIRTILHVNKLFGKTKFSSYPRYNLFTFVINQMLSNYINIFPFYFLDYYKQDAQKLIIEKYDWQYYGEHHHESLFTKFAIGYWLYNKFGIDKRKVTYSAQIRENVITREEALNIIKQPPFPENKLKDNELNYLCNKLGINESEFDEIWNSKNHSFTEYNNYYKDTMILKEYFPSLLEKILKRKPGTDFLKDTLK